MAGDPKHTHTGRLYMWWQSVHRSSVQQARRGGGKGIEGCASAGARQSVSTCQACDYTMNTGSDDIGASRATNYTPQD